MNYDRDKPLNEFITKFNEMISKLADMDNRQTGFAETVQFIVDEIIPRYTERPAVFESTESMQQSDVLEEGDVCIAFRDGQETSYKYAELYKVDLIANRPSEQYIALKKDTLGAYEIVTSDSSLIEAIALKEDRVKKAATEEGTNDKGIWIIVDEANMTIKGLRMNGYLLDVDIPLATSSEPGLMKAEHFNKLAEFTEDDIDKWNAKQDALTPGANITIDESGEIKAVDTIYVHPETHPASIITESETKRFVSDEEKARWNNKATEEMVSSALNSWHSGTIVPLEETTTQLETKVNNLSKEDVGLGNVQNIGWLFVTAEEKANLSEEMLNSPNYVVGTWK